MLEHIQQLEGLPSVEDALTALHLVKQLQTLEQGHDAIADKVATTRHMLQSQLADMESDQVEAEIILEADDDALEDAMAEIEDIQVRRRCRLNTSG